MKELLVFIPAYNEQDNIEKVVKDIKEHCTDVDFVVIDDGSTDDTVRICREKNIPYLSLPINLGLDGVFQTGDKMKEGYDIVIGSRFVDRKKHRSLRMAGSRLLSGMFRLTTGKRFTDPTSGMRLVSRKIMKQIAFDPNCGAEPDTWAYFVRKGARLAEVQVEMNEREAGTSYFTLGRSIAYMFRMLISMAFINLFRGKEER